MNWILDHFFQLITACVALYGAGLSTYTFIANRKEKRRHLSVTISNGCLTYGAELSPLMLFITVANPGNRKVTINSPSIQLPNKKTIIFPIPLSNVRFPYELDEGKSCMIWTEMKEIKKQLRSQGYPGSVRIKAKVRDAVDKLYWSKKSWKIDLDEE